MVLDSRIRGAWDHLMKPVGSTLARSGVSANAITVGGLLLQLAAAALILDGRLLVAGAVATAAALSDALDGAVAKAQGTGSVFGALIDSTTDRLSDALLFLPIAWLYGVAPPGDKSGQEWVAALSLAVMVVSFLVSYVKARAEGLGFECNMGIIERAERLILMILGLALDLVPVALIVVGTLSVITLAQRLLYVRAQIRSVSAHE